MSQSVELRGGVVASGTPSLDLSQTDILLRCWVLRGGGGGPNQPMKANFLVMPMNVLGPPMGGSNDSASILLTAAAAAAPVTRSSVASCVACVSIA